MYGSLETAVRRGFELSSVSGKDITMYCPSSLLLEYSVNVPPSTVSTEPSSELFPPLDFLRDSFPF